MPENIRLQITEGAGAPQLGQDGGVQVTAESTLQLSVTGATGAKTAKYRIYEYPDGYALPAGWTLEGNAYVAVVANAGASPPFEAPAAEDWGGFLVDVEVDDRKRNGQIVEDLYDNTLGFYVESPSGIPDVLYLEAGQFDQHRKWAGQLKRIVRYVDSGVGGGGSGGSGDPSACALFQISAPETGESEAVLGTYFAFTNDAGFNLEVGPDTETTRVALPTLGARYQITVGVDVNGLPSGTHSADISVLGDGGAVAIAVLSTSAVTAVSDQTVDVSRSLIVDVPEDAIDPYVCVHLPSASPGETVNGLLTIERMGSGGGGGGGDVEDGSITLAKLAADAIPALHQADGGDLTIAAGAITVGAAGRYRVFTEAGADSDTLTTITGGSDGQVIVLTVGDLKSLILDNLADNIVLARSRDLVLAGSVYSSIALQRRGSVWVELTHCHGAPYRVFVTSGDLALSDCARERGIIASAATPRTLTIPSALSIPADSIIPVTNVGAGLLTITAEAGVTINGVDAESVTLAQYKSCIIWYIGSDDWYAIGGIS